MDKEIIDIDNPISFKYVFPTKVQFQAEEGYPLDNTGKNDGVETKQFLREIADFMLNRAHGGTVWKVYLTSDTGRKINEMMNKLIIWKHPEMNRKGAKK